MESTSAKSEDDDVPALAETDVELWTDLLGDYISVWMRNSQQFIAEHQQKIYKLALCPFLFGVSHNLPEAWLEVLHIYGIIETDRENQTTTLSDVEMKTLDMAETIFKRCSQLVSNKNDLKTILNFIYEVEERSALLGRIDMNYALQEVTSLEVFASMWAPIKRLFEEKKKKRQAHVCIVYYFKIISYHVTQYGQNGADSVKLLESILFHLFRPDELTSVTREDAQKAVCDGDYLLALEQCSTLLERDPLNSRLYSLRAEIYEQLHDCWAALSDCRRSFVLEPGHCQFYYMATDMCLEVGQVDKPYDFNQHLLDCSLDEGGRAKVQQQAQKVQAKRAMTKLRDTPASTDSEQREISYTQYTKLICDGSDLYLSEVYNKAGEQFKAALDVIASSTSQELNVEGDELAFIWLVYGLSCVKTEHTRNVQAAIEKFNAVISRTQTFPAAFYGLALAYIKFKRYQEAGSVLKTGLARLEHCGDVKIFNWPGTDTVVEETVAPTLKKLMENLLKETVFPPKPDAVCKFHIDTDILKKEMYFCDPDYKGHVCIKCRADCSIDFHAQCWKPNDGNSRGKHNWKEVLDTPCPTPACWGTISEVYICRPGPDKNLKLSSQMEVKPRPSRPQPKLKMKTASPTKLERKLEMKRIRKEMRQEARQVLQDQQASEQQLEDGYKILLPPEEDVVNINIDRTGTVLRKDEPEMVVEQKKQKAGKNKKKEKKQKQFLALDVQFKGDENKERYGINSLDDDGDVVNIPGTFGLLPTPGSDPKLVITQSQQLQQSALEIALYEFFYKLLLAKGPLDLLGAELEERTKHLSEEAQTCILSYGGLDRFLAAHRQFLVSQNKVVSAVPRILLGIPHLVPQLNPGLVPQVNPGLVPQGNPWENRQHKPTDTQNVWSSQGQWLNPGARVFVPQDTAGAEVSPVTQQRDQVTDVCVGGVGSKSSDELAADDDGFTTVVSKRRVSVQKPSLVQLNPGLVPQVNPGLVPQGNPWENRQHKPTDTQNVWSSQGQWLNPGARVFVPQDTAGAEVSPVTQQRDQVTDVCVGGVGSKSSDELAADDDGFTTVVSKRRVSVQKPSLVQPDVHKFAFLKPASCFSSLEDIHVHSQLPQKAQQPPVTALEGEKHMVDDGKHINVPHGNMDSLDLFLDDPSDTDPCERKGAVEWKIGVLSPINKPGPGSDVSDLSADDLYHRVSSPALSTNSGSSSGRAEDSQAASQTSGQLTSLRPLKAPSVVLPTRGKNKRLIAFKLHSHQRPADSSHVSDGCEEESVSSTTSDRDSMSGDARAASTDHMPPMAVSPGRDSTSGGTEQASFSTASGQDVSSSPAQDSRHHPSMGFQEDLLAGSGIVFRKTSDSDGIIARAPGFEGGIQQWQMGPDSLAAKKVPQDSSQRDEVLVKSDNVVNERQEGNRKETFDNWATQTAGQQEFNLVTGGCEQQTAVNMSSLPDATWSSWGWGLSGSFRKTSDGADNRLPPNDPWQNKDQTTAHFYTDLYQERPELPTMSTNTDTCEDKRLLSNKEIGSGVFHLDTFSKEYGLIGSGKVKDTDPLFSRSVASPTSLSTDITFHDHRSLPSPFPAWVNGSTTSPSTELRSPPPSAAEPSHLSTEPSHLSTEPSHLSTEPSHLSTEPSHLSTEPSHLSTEPSHLSTEPSHLSTEPCVYTLGTSTKSSVYSIGTSGESSVNISSAPTEPSDTSTLPSVYTTDSSTMPSVYTTDSSTMPSVYTTDSSTLPSVYTTDSSTMPSVYTTDSSTMPSGATSEPMSLTIDSSSEPLLHPSLTRTAKNRSNIEPSASSPSFAGPPAHVRTAGERLAAVWGQLDIGNVEARTTQRRTVDTQTSCTGSQIEEMLVSLDLLKDSRAQLASALHEKLQLQEQLTQERSVRDQVKLENHRLLTKVDMLQTSADKWKDDCSQLIQTSEQLNDQLGSQAETINQLNHQLHMFTTTALNAQMDALSMKKELVTNKIDMKQQEALHHFQRLSNVIAQAKTSDKQLPESVCEKQTEFSEYIATCERLSKHIQVIYLRLAGDLQRGLPVDVSQLQVSPPTFPKSPTESSDRPQASSASLPHGDYSNPTQPSVPHSMASLHSSPSRGRSSIHSSPSRGRSSIHSSPSRGQSSIHSSPSGGCSSIHSSPPHSRGTPPPCNVSSVHSSSSLGSPSSHTSPPHSIASLHSSTPRARATIRTSPPPGRDHQKKAWSALQPQVPTQETEDADEDAYLRMIYGGSSSKNSLTSRSPAQAENHKQTVPDVAGRQGWKPSSCRLLSSPTQLTSLTARVSSGVPGSQISPGHRLSKLITETARTSAPTIRPHTSRPGAHQNHHQVPYFERIVQTVQEKLPECSRNTIQKVVDTLRRKSGGTLSGWTFEPLANEILEMILDLEQEQQLATFGNMCAPDEHLSNSVWDSGSSELTCSICQCQMEPREALTLSCGHQFHEGCVQKWLTNDRSCPNCRSHALLPRDFPVLK